MGLLVLYQILDKFQYILMDTEGKILQTFSRATDNPAITQLELDQMITLHTRIGEQSKY